MNQRESMKFYFMNGAAYGVITGGREPVVDRQLLASNDTDGEQLLIANGAVEIMPIELKEIGEYKVVIYLIDGKELDVIVSDEEYQRFKKAMK